MTKHDDLAMERQLQRWERTYAGEVCTPDCRAHLVRTATAAANDAQTRAWLEAAGEVDQAVRNSEGDLVDRMRRLAETMRHKAGVKF